MNNAASAYADELTALKKKYRLLMGLVCGLIILWTITFIGQFSNSAQASQKGDSQNKSVSQTQQTLQIRELVVVDENNTPRVRIAGDLPDPIMLGKRSKRGGKNAGVMLYDAEGNERGGYVTGERSISLTLDEISRMAVILSVNDKGGIRFRMGNGQGAAAEMSVLPTGSSLRLYNSNKPPTIFPLEPEGEKK